LKGGGREGGREGLLTSKFGLVHLGEGGGGDGLGGNLGEDVLKEGGREGDREGWED